MIFENLFIGLPCIFKVDKYFFYFDYGYFVFLIYFTYLLDIDNTNLDQL